MIKEDVKAELRVIALSYGVKIRDTTRAYNTMVELVDKCRDDRGYLILIKLAEETERVCTEIKFGEKNDEVWIEIAHAVYYDQEM